MKDYLKEIPQELQELIGLISEISAQSNTPAYLVGGIVRDLILGVNNLDLDIVVEGDGIKFAESLGMRLKAKVIRHTRFGTATVEIRRNLKIDPSTSLRVNGERSRTIDIASAREECYPEPACLPSVKSGSVKDDLKRRDFTINAMALSLNRLERGKIIDFFGGLNDLRDKKVRILHNLSFIDDPTRILRAIRFEQRLKFRLEAGTLKQLKEAVRLGMLEKVQPQRLRDELILILKEKNAAQQLKRLNELAGLDFINPHLKLSRQAYLLLKSIEKEVALSKNISPLRRHLDIWLVYFMALLDSLDIGQIRHVFKLYVFRKGEEIRIISFKKTGPRFIRQLCAKVIIPSRLFKMFDHLSYEVLIMLKAKYRNKFLHKNIDNFLKDFHFIRLHVTGHDLYKLGVKPGPSYQKIFQKALNAKLDGKVQTKEEEIELIKKLLNRS